jgi:transposase
VPRTNPTYPPEFRREAIRLVRASDQEHPIPGIAREIGVSDGTLRYWVNQDEIDSGQREGLTTQEKEELRKLRREVKTLRQEKEILRKAWLRPAWPSLPGKRSYRSVSIFRLIDLRRRPATRWRCCTGCSGSQRAVTTPGDPGRPPRGAARTSTSPRRSARSIAGAAKLTATQGCTPSYACLE